jgi:hypothetical protein
MMTVIHDFGSVSRVVATAGSECGPRDTAAIEAAQHKTQLGYVNLVASPR